MLGAFSLLVQGVLETLLGISFVAVVSLGMWLLWRIFAWPSNTVRNGVILAFLVISLAAAYGASHAIRHTEPQVAHNAPSPKASPTPCIAVAPSGPTGISLRGVSNARVEENTVAGYRNGIAAVCSNNVRAVRNKVTLPSSSKPR
jgi:parallel beta-helix repeat protein